MAYRTSESVCTVHIVRLWLTPAQERQCEALRREAGRCWTDMVNAHVASRAGQWLSEGGLKTTSKGHYALHSQSIQALAEKLIANVDAAHALRQQEAQTGQVHTRYPYKDKPYQTVTWKDQAIRRRDGQIVLSNGRGREPLVLDLPTRYHDTDICKAELLWRADHYELAITIDSGAVNPPLSRRVKTAGVDLGEVNIAAVVTEEGKGIVISGRYLRSLKRLRNKRHQAYSQLLARCQANSRRARRLKKRKAQASAQFYRQQRDTLHKASRQVVEFCKREQVAKVAVGDVRDIGDGVNLGQSNQKVSQWPHGQFVDYVSYKGRAYGMATDYHPEDYSTRTCCQCGRVLSQAPRGRVYRCPGCGSCHSRDGNGGANICSRARYGRYGQVHIKHITYLRPIRCVGVSLRSRLSPPQ